MKSERKNGGLDSLYSQEEIVNLAQASHPLHPNNQAERNQVPPVTNSFMNMTNFSLAELSESINMDYYSDWSHAEALCLHLPALLP